MCIRDRLNNPVSVAIAKIGSTTYAVVTAAVDDAITIIDISTDPTSPSNVGEIVDSGGRELDGPNGVAVATIDGKTYAVVVGQDDGIAIIDISTPSSPVYAGEMEDDSNKNGCTAVQMCLDGAKGVVITEIGGKTYAVVTGYYDDGIEIIQIMHSHT